MKPTTVHRCKLHGHPYTVCPLCACEYCVQTWPVCPRASWHPAHGTTPEEIGRRYQALEQGRQEGIRRREETP